MYDFTATLDRKATIVEFEDMSNLLGYKKAEVIGKNWFDIFIENNNMTEILDVFYTLFSSGQVQVIESYSNDIKHKNGKHIFVDFDNTMYKNEVGELMLRTFAKEHHK